MTLEVGVDVLPPVHCFEESNNCTKDALTATDFLTEVYISNICCVTIFFSLLLTKC